MSKRQSKTGLIWVIACVPILAAFAGIGVSDWRSSGAVLNYLGRLAGIAGLAMLLLAAALSARVPGFDRHFGGLTRLWRTHHLLGAGALLLLLAHPLLLALAAAEVSPATAAATLVPPFSATGLWLGWAALVLMMIFLAPSFKFFGEPDYQRWKWIHRLSGPAVILALTHTFMYGRTMPANLDVALWVALALLAGGAVVYRFAFSRRIGRLPYAVERVDTVANNLVELHLSPKKKPLRYSAGQFVYLTPYDRNLEAGYREEHPYTISSSPDEKRLRIAIKDLGDASRAIQNIAPGSEVGIEGPYGYFFPEGEQSAQELWIAGGIGITPFLGRARHLAGRDAGTDIHLVYCVQDEARARFLDELQSLVETLPGFRVTPHFFYREGPLSADFLRAYCPDFAKRECYVCGPLPLNDLARRILRSAGVPSSHIHSEEFTLL